MSKRKREPLGRGIESLFTEKPKEEGEVEQVVVDETVEEPSGEPSDVDATMMERVIKEAEGNPRVSVYSKRACAVFRYLHNTVPAFNISSEARDLLEKSIREKYPRLWERVKELG